jgi:methionine synthase II (cobalamin-independent)
MTDIRSFQPDGGCGAAAEPVEKLRDRAAAWARLVGEERLWLSPTCGFGRHPARDVPVLRQEMEHRVEAAASL